MGTAVPTSSCIERFESRWHGSCVGLETGLMLQHTSVCFPRA